MASFGPRTSLGGVGQKLDRTKIAVTGRQNSICLTAYVELTFARPTL